jgi:cytochrome c-type biogenesis protein CcmH/NrfF
VRQVNWAIWLLVPVTVTVLAAIVTWWRSRPERTPTTQEAMQDHTEFLDALVQVARSKDRGLRNE